MTFTLTLNAWLIPALLTFMIWTTAILFPAPQPTGAMFDFGPMLTKILHGFLAIVATLLVWLLWFAGLWWFA